MMNFNPFSDIYHSLWDDMTCRGIEQHDNETTLIDWTRQSYDESLKRFEPFTTAGIAIRHGGFEGYSELYWKFVPRCQDHSLALNPTVEQLKKNPYLYIITEVMVGDCDES